jgi:hypothetical protein
VQQAKADYENILSQAANSQTFQPYATERWQVVSNSVYLNPSNCEANSDYCIVTGPVPPSTSSTAPVPQSVTHTTGCQTRYFLWWSWRVCDDKWVGKVDNLAT